MKKNLLYFAGFIFPLITVANPVMPMNRAFRSLAELVPYLANEVKFVEKKNETTLIEHMQEMEGAFKAAKHAGLLKQDIFAPSMEIIQEEIKESLEAFRKGKKDYAWWRMRSITAQCMACHTRLPSNHSSSFQDSPGLVDKSKFEGPYNLGIAYLIVRQYPEAKQSFTRVLDDSLIKKNFKGFLSALKQVLLIQTKVMRDPAQMLSVLKHYQENKDVPTADKEVMKIWSERLRAWTVSPLSRYQRISTIEEARAFMDKVMRPLFKNNNLYIGKHDVDLLMASGPLSNFLFENPESKAAPEALYWIGISEKYLERENFFGTGEHFLKRCVVKYPKAPIAKECFAEYKESVEFNFSGSRGTDIPDEVQRELDRLGKMVGL